MHFSRVLHEFKLLIIMGVLLRLWSVNAFGNQVVYRATCVEPFYMLPIWEPINLRNKYETTRVKSNMAATGTWFQMVSSKHV